MAKTAKADQIGIEKDALIRAIDRIRLEVSKQALKVPESVLKGDARIAQLWLERQEHATKHYKKVVNKRKTVDDLKRILADEQLLLELLQHITVDTTEVVQAAQSDNLDLFGA